MLSDKDAAELVIAHAQGALWAGLIRNEDGFRNEIQGGGYGRVKVQPGTVYDLRYMSVGVWGVADAVAIYMTRQSTRILAEFMLSQPLMIDSGVTVTVKLDLTSYKLEDFAR